MITKPVQLISKTVQVPHHVPRYYHGSIQTQNQSKWLINVNVNQKHDRKDLIDLMIKAYFTILPNSQLYDRTKSSLSQIALIIVKL